jgi:hypothetical protein
MAKFIASVERVLEKGREIDFPCSWEETQGGVLAPGEQLWAVGMGHNGNVARLIEDGFDLGRVRFSSRVQEGFLGLYIIDHRLATQVA